MISTQAVADAFRSDAHDAVEPYLWSDADVIRYMNAARTELLRRAWGLAETWTYALAAHQREVTIPARLLKIRRALADNKPVELVSIHEVDDFYAARTSTTVRALVHDETTSMIGVYPDLTRPVNLTLMVYALPALPITVLGPTVDTELPDSYELLIPITLWMRHYAYLKDDVETFSKTQSELMLQLAMKASDDYRRRVERREHHTRVVGHGVPCVEKLW